MDTFSGKGRNFILIVIPIFVTQIALMGMSFFDTTMSGQAGAEQLAGVAIAVSLWVPANTGLTGILLAITPMVAQYIGAKEEKKVVNIISQGIYVAVIVAVLIIGIGVICVPIILDMMRLDLAVEKVAKGFLTAIAFGIIPHFVYTVLRCFIDALGKTKVTMLITLSSLPINIVLNYFLIFGKAGLPKMGGIGAGIASAITHWIILFIAISVIRKSKTFIEYGVLRSAPKVIFSLWKEILTLGIPIGLAIFFETSIFSVVTLLMSEFSTATIAAHQVAMNFASLLYMSPLSISMAMTIVVGKEVGAKRFSHAKQYTILGVGTALCISFICALIIIFFHGQVASMYTNDPTVIVLAQHFLMYALFFQVSDAIAAPIQGALRGYKDVNATLIMTMVAYWIIGLPLGYVLGNYTNLGASGYWIGLISGLAFAALSLSIRLIRLQKQRSKEVAMGVA